MFRLEWWKSMTEKSMFNGDPRGGNEDEFASFGPHIFSRQFSCRKMKLLFYQFPSRISVSCPVGKVPHFLICLFVFLLLCPFRASTTLLACLNRSSRGCHEDAVVGNKPVYTGGMYNRWLLGYQRFLQRLRTEFRCSDGRTPLHVLSYLTSAGVL